jgi:hypothetical protein
MRKTLSISLYPGTVPVLISLAVWGWGAPGPFSAPSCSTALITMYPFGDESSSKSDMPQTPCPCIHSVTRVLVLVNSKKYDMQYDSMQQLS